VTGAAGWRPLDLRLDRLSLCAGGKPDGRRLCDGLDLRVAPGERWVILGPNGAGKSTLLMAVAGLLPPNAGRVFLGDRALSGWPGEELARARAWCPQLWLDPFPVTACETVAAAVLATNGREDAGSVERTAHHWLGELDAAPLAERDVRSLSGGERQRVALATALAQAAPLLLLDEPTSHLDWPHQGLLREQLARWSARQGTVLLAMHDVNLAWLLATHALLLDGKGNAVHGPRDDVLTAAAIGKVYGLSVTVVADGDSRWFRARLEERR